MKTKIIKLYSFDELDQDQQQKAIENLYDINVDHDWWHWTYDDAEEIGLKIESFDLDRNRHATGYLKNSLSECCELILKNHGKDCETAKTAEDFLIQWGELVAKHSDGINTNEVHEDNEHEFDQEADELEKEFLMSLLEDYSIILQNESEYLMSDEAIIETIKANEYYFDEDGNIG